MRGLFSRATLRMGVGRSRSPETARAGGSVVPSGMAGEAGMTLVATCGQGLVQNAVLPLQVSRLIAALAEVLDAHRPALDLDDPAGRDEEAVYSDLVRRYRRVADELQGAAERMSAAGGLPAARHEERVMAGGRAREAFAALVSCEQDLARLLQERLPADQQMLGQMGGTR
jgi:hypothetical protein